MKFYNNPQSLFRMVWNDLTPLGKYTIGLPLIGFLYLLAGWILVLVIIAWPFYLLSEKLTPTMRIIRNLFFKKDQAEPNQQGFG